MSNSFLPIIGKTLNYGNLISDWSINRGLISRWLTLPLLKGRPRLIDIASINNGIFAGYGSDSPWRGALGRPGGFGCTYYDGINNYANCGSTQLLNPPVASGGGWVRLSSSISNAWAVFLARWGAVDLSYHLSAMDGSGNLTPRIFLSNGAGFSDCTSSVTISYGQWAHIFFTNDGVTGKIFVNGKETGSTGSVGGTMPLNNTETWIGGQSGNSLVRFAGELDDICLCSRVFTNNEVYGLYEDSRRGYPKSLNWLSGTKYFTPSTITGIAFDAVSNSGYQAASSSYSWSHVCTGSDRFLAVDISLLSAGNTVSSITYNGVALSPISGAAISSVTSFGRVECWGLVNPSSGSNTITVTLSGSIISAGTAVSYTGVQQTSPTEAGNAAQATNVGAADATVTITSVADNDWIHAAIATDDASVTAGQTNRNNVTGLGGSGANEDTGPITPAAGTAMTYTGVGALATWAIAGYAIRPVDAGSLGRNVPIGSLFSRVRGIGVGILTS